MAHEKFRRLPKDVGTAMRGDVKLWEVRVTDAPRADQLIEIRTRFGSRLDET